MESRKALAVVGNLSIIQRGKGQLSVRPMDSSQQRRECLLGLYWPDRMNSKRFGFESKLSRSASKFCSARTSSRLARATSILASVCPVCRYLGSNSSESKL